MNAALDLKGRSLAETLAELQNRVRTQPGDAKLRTFLFQLLSVMGQWDRAINQLGVAGELDVSALAMVQMYREALKCEALRADVFAGRRSPVVFGDPEPWVALVIEALKLSAEGRHEQAATLRAQAFEQAPATSGKLLTAAAEAAATGDDRPAGEPFEWIADADSRLGPILEAVVLGRYMWIPLSRVRRIDVEAPTDLRDLVWAPVHFQWINGGEGVGVIPTRYPGTEASTEDALRLAKRTEWQLVSEGAYHGLGQRMLATDAGEFPLLDVRRIDLDSPAPAQGSGGGL
jgi:type VI secretion system protein ImpE